MLSFGQTHLTGWTGGGLGFGGIAIQRRPRDARPFNLLLERYVMTLKKKLPVLVPQRRRIVPASFAWIDHRLRADGWLQRFEPADFALYLFLVMAADRDGLSCWRLDRIERAVPCFDRHALWDARERMMQLDLIAYRPWRPHNVDGSYQVLSLPPGRPSYTAAIGEMTGEIFPRIDP